jgi:hypothetical protein
MTSPSILWLTLDKMTLAFLIPINPTIQSTSKTLLELKIALETRVVQKPKTVG